MQVEMSELEELECIYCELHKDVYGVKARWYRAATVEQARKDIDTLRAAGEVAWAREQEAQKEAAVRFEAYVQDTITAGAKDRATALAWIHQAEGTQGNDEFLAYNMGLPYKYFN